MKNVSRMLALALAIVMCVGVIAGCAKPPVTDPTQTGSAGTTGTQAPTIDPNATQPVDISKYSEAPYITNLGTFGKVEDRLPVEADIFVENAAYLEVGVYGGELKTSTSSSSWTAGKIIEEGLFRFKTDGSVEANVAKSYEVNEDATVYTIHLREGMKWSDGQPFTAEDCVWFYNSICLNKVDSKGVRNCHKDANGNPATVEKIDDYTFTVTFGTSKYDFIETLCVDLKWHYAPKHIFENFVNAVIAGDEATALAEAKAICGVEFADSSKAGKEMLYYFWNYPGIPTLNPYVLSTEEGKNDKSGDYYEYVRNPYYWKVDVQGQQLPYIDKITYTAIQNVDQSLLLLLDGTVDFQTVGMEAISTIKTDASVGINIYEWSTGSWGDTGTQIHFNLNSSDANLKALFNNPAFREAISICVDREEFAGLYSDGWVEPGQAAPAEGALGYSEAWATKWTEYDVDKAKTLLQSCGLVMGDDGFWNFADGSDFLLTINAVADSGAANTYAILETYYRAVGIECAFKDYDRTNVDNMMLANEINCVLFPVTGIGDISIVLKPNSMIPGFATNVVWYGNMTKETATGDLLKLIELKEQLDKTSGAEERTAIAQQMLALHEANQWTIAYVAASPTYHAVNSRIHNFLSNGVWSDIYRDLGIAHVQCWFIPADQQ